MKFWRNKEIRNVGQLGQRAKPAEKVLVNPVQEDLAYDLAPDMMDFTPQDCLSFSDAEWLRIWYVRRWPRELGYANWQALLTFPGDLRVSMFFEPLPPGAVGKQLEQQETSIQSARLLRTHQRRDPSPSQDKLYEEIKEERQLVEISGDPFYFLTVVIGLFADSQESLSHWSEELENHCRNIGLVITRAKWEQEEGLKTLLPHNMNALGDHRRNARVDTLMNLFPFVGDEIVMPEGIFYGHDTQTGKAVVFDPFQQVNPNCILIGTSGGGKSYWMKDTIEQLLLDGVRVFALDIENEYRHLCNDLGGLYLDMGIEGEHKINVLAVDLHDPDGMRGSLEAFKSWMATVLRRELSTLEEDVLDQAHHAAYLAKGIQRDDRATYQKAPPLLSDLREVLRTMADHDPLSRTAALELASALGPMATGGLSHAFNCHTSVDVGSNPLIVFGLSTVHPSMMSKRIRQIQMFTWSQMTREDRTVEIVDEAWWLLAQEGTAAELDARARRFRKKNAALFIATQHPEDFAANRHAHAILDIVGTHLIFQQSDTSIDNIAALYKLNKAEKLAITQLEPGHYFLKTSKLKMLMYRPILRERHGLYTTRPGDVSLTH